MQSPRPRPTPGALCGVPSTAKCGACPTLYCSKDHQRQHWKTHKLTCPAAARTQTHPPPPPFVAALTPAVRRFNSLGRHPLAPSGLVPNHWHFSIRRITLPPASDVLLLVSPPSRYMHIERPTTPTFISSLDPDARAAVIVPMLLKGFNSGLGGPETRAPFTWATNDVETARAVERELATVGVRRICGSCRRATGRKTILPMKGGMT
ncbi:uncharacterized protein EV422DRAFT_538986 [Fimicolochytrium jonesii]|uniref:uncharacterized protein n=1 Tax=Fimicolochytrium jonesii TaxID=1396493 RepID=UPI0022FECC4F|nr:uncharacterized protein EV422DRAFT_538986 [Fimicolochytrium jonesii]KAI8818185.1 hypothetical protein EV422DRAFT_538986 [Fimicolochytrium jonesii]